jgi:predicted dithiol-disulfide oxidoreductase (DUF899 family)
MSPAVVGGEADGAEGPGLERVRTLRRHRVPHVLDHQPRLEPLMAYYGVLDRTPLGRNEGDPPEMCFRRHDEYGQAGTGRTA